MRGEFVHNNVLIAPVEAVLREYSVPYWREHAIVSNRNVGAAFADVFAICGRLRFVCEAELTPDRVWNDVIKAVSLEANLLLILVPNARVARRVRNRLRRPGAPPVPKSLEVWILPLGKALQQLREKVTLMTRVNAPESSSRQKNPSSNSIDAPDPRRGGCNP